MTASTIASSSNAVPLWSTRATPAPTPESPRRTWSRREARRIAIGVTALLLLLAAAWAAALWLRPADSADRYAVVDGDTLALWPRHCLLSRLGIGCLGQRLRLYGVDAFESTQTCRDAKGTLWHCGAVATERLRQLVTQADFACHVDPEFVDRHAR